MAEFVAISGSMFALGSALAWKQWIAIDFVAGFGLAGLGVIAFLYTLRLALASSVQYPGGATVSAIPYPQTVYPLVWGLIVIALIPINWLLSRKIRALRVPRAESTTLL